MFFLVIHISLPCLKQNLSCNHYLRSDSPASRVTNPEKCWTICPANQLRLLPGTCPGCEPLEGHIALKQELPLLVPRPPSVTSRARCWAARALRVARAVICSPHSPAPHSSHQERGCSYDDENYGAPTDQRPTPRWKGAFSTLYQRGSLLHTYLQPHSALFKKK